MKSIMFICSGNICRSPMAHFYMQKRVKDLNIEENYIIRSCGTQAINGQKATENAVQAISYYEEKMIDHRATNIHDINIEDYDLILCMTKRHKEIVQSSYPKLKSRVYTLKEYSNPENPYKDIDDPWGLSLEVYKKCLEEIVENVDKIIEKY